MRASAWAHGGHLLVAEERANAEFNRIEGLGAHRRLPSRAKRDEVTVRRPAVHCKCLGGRVDDPIVRDPGGPIELQLVDEIRLGVRCREDLADPVRPDAYGPSGGALGNALAAPAAEIGAD